MQLGKQINKLLRYSSRSQAIMTLYFAMIYFSHYVLKLDINVGYRCFIIVFDSLALIISYKNKTYEMVRPVKFYSGIMPNTRLQFNWMRFLDNKNSWMQ